MLRQLIEAIRIEAAERGQIDKWTKSGVVAKRGAARFMRQKTKGELKKVIKDPSHEPSIPRRGTSGYES
jgi:hypothetical protein